MPKKNKHPKLTEPQIDALGLLRSADWVEHTFIRSKDYTTGVQAFIKRENRECFPINAQVFKNLRERGLFKHGMTEDIFNERGADMPPHTHVYMPTPKLYEAYVLWSDENGAERFKRLMAVFEAGKIDSKLMTELAYTINEEAPWTLVPPHWQIVMMNSYVQEHGSSEALLRMAQQKIEIFNSRIAGLLWNDVAAFMLFNTVIKEIYGNKVSAIRYDEDNQESSGSEIVLRLNNSGMADLRDFDVSLVVKEFNRLISAQEKNESSERPYENLTQAQKNAVDAAWRTVKNEFEFAGFKAANNDHAEELVDALTKYLLKSNPEAVEA